MSKDWHAVWEGEKQGFHKKDVHGDLMDHEDRFLGSTSRRILVPLCGKTPDMIWLADRGHDVVGVELVPRAVEAFFEDNELDYEEAELGPLPVYRAGSISLICANIFAALPGLVGTFDRIWDRAALVALPRDTRAAYARALRELAAPGALLLQNAFEYDQDKMSGPPFSVPDEELRSHYGDQECELLRERDSLAAMAQFREHGHDYWIERSYLIRLQA